MHICVGAIRDIWNGLFFASDLAKRVQRVGLGWIMFSYRTWHRGEYNHIFGFSKIYWDDTTLLHRTLFSRTTSTISSLVGGRLWRFNSSMTQEVAESVLPSVDSPVLAYTSSIFSLRGWICRVARRRHVDLRCILWLKWPGLSNVLRRHYRAWLKMQADKESVALPPIILFLVPCSVILIVRYLRSWQLRTHADLVQSPNNTFVPNAQDTTHVNYSQVSYWQPGLMRLIPFAQ